VYILDRENKPQQPEADQGPSNTKPSSSIQQNIKKRSHTLFTPEVRSSFEDIIE